MAVTMKLSRQDAKYLVSLLDAVARATAAVEQRAAVPCRYDRKAATEAIAEVIHDAEKHDVRPLASAQAARILEVLDLILPRHEREESAVRAQRLMNGLPFSEWAADHRFALRVGAVLQSGINIADERNEV